MTKAYSKIGLSIIKIMESLDKQKRFKNKTIYDYLFEIDYESKKSFHNYLINEFKPFFNFEELQLTKNEFIIHNIVDKKEPYYTNFENMIIEEWTSFGLKVEDLDKLHNIKEQKKIMSAINFSKFTENQIKEISEIGGYYILKKHASFSFIEDRTPLLYYLNRTLNTENLLEEKMFEKYMNRRQEDIAFYLNIEKNKINDLFYFLFTNPMLETQLELAYMDKNKFMSKNIFDIEIPKEFENANMNAIQKCMINIYNIINTESGHIFDTDKVIFNECFNYGMKNTLLIHLKNIIISSSLDSDFSLSMIIRMTEIENMENFLTHLVTTTFEYFLIDYIKYHIILLDEKSNEDSCKEDNIFESKLKEQDSKIMSLEDNIKLLEIKNNQLSQEIISKDKKMYEIEKCMDDKYKKEIIELQKKLKQSNENIIKLTEDNKELTKIRNTLFSLEDEKEDSFDLNKVDLSQFEDKRYMFVGGRFELLKKLEGIFPKSKFYHVKPTNNIDIKKIDKIVIFPKNINHPLYWEAIDAAKKNNIPFMFTLGTNLETVMRDIVSEL